MLAHNCILFSFNSHQLKKTIFQSTHKGRWKQTMASSGSTVLKWIKFCRNGHCMGLEALQWFLLTFMGLNCVNSICCAHNFKLKLSCSDEMIYSSVVFSGLKLSDELKLVVLFYTVVFRRRWSNWAHSKYTNHEVASVMMPDVFWEVFQQEKAKHLLNWL